MEVLIESLRGCLEKVFCQMYPLCVEINAVLWHFATCLMTVVWGNGINWGRIYYGHFRNRNQIEQSQGSASIDGLVFNADDRLTVSLVASIRLYLSILLCRMDKTAAVGLQ